MSGDVQAADAARTLIMALCAAMAGSAAVASRAAAQDAPLSWGHPAQVRPADAAEIRRVIAGQIEAFSFDHRDGAYSSSAPNVRRKFPTPDAFRTMALRDYAPLFKVEREAFDATRGAAATSVQAETWSQSVEIGTRDGEHWTAVYGLERQADGSIAITSCVMIRRSDSFS